MSPGLGYMSYIAWSYTSLPIFVVAGYHPFCSQSGRLCRSQCCCWGDFTRSKDKGLLCRVWTALALTPFSKLLFIRIYIWIYTYTKIQKSFGVSKARPREILNHFGQQPQYIPPEPQFFQRMRCSVSFLHFAHLRLCARRWNWYVAVWPTSNGFDFEIEWRRWETKTEQG